MHLVTLLKSPDKRTNRGRGHSHVISLSMPVRKNVSSAERDESRRPFQTVGAAWLNARLANSVLTGNFRNTEVLKC